ncbi:MAG TPA: adenylate/guanylate cyclase domain-containing protein [Kofleriaceae bacterium]|nr:adenylate/guanylate cyclase domain-containing protein [Kofleriaceae bacterium]
MLDRLIDAHARRAELLLVACRLLVAVSSLANALFFPLPVEPMATHGSVIIGLHLSSIAGYASIGIAARRSKNLGPVLLVSIALDAASILFFLVPGVLWPGPTHRGVLTTIGMGLLPLAVVAAGCRFRLRLALAGIGLGLAVALSLVVLDGSRNAVTYQPGTVFASSILFAAGAVLALLIATITRRMVFEAAQVATQARRAQEKLRVYVSDEVAREVEDGAAERTVSEGGQQRHVAVLFCDLRDFTVYSRTVDPRQLVLELNAYFDALVPVIQQHGGTVDKFIGDAIMAVFTHEDGSSPALEALATAGAMKDALAEHNRLRAARGQPRLRHGIGIHAGWAVAGNVGTQDRMQHTVIGDVVNVAARLERATKESGTWLLCSRPVWEAVRQAPLRAEGLPRLAPIGALELRGLEGPIEAYGPDEPNAAV